jgi:LuxR family maltose regulon positive regulatory protein
VALEARPVAWLTIDNLDNDPAILVSYLAAALDRIAPVDPAIASGLSGTGERVLGSAVPRLASSLHGWERPAVLVIDDVHRLVAQGCLDALAALLEHLPSGFRVALAGRLEPLVSLDRVRASGDLLELRREDLALDDAEAGDLLAGMGTPVAPRQAKLVNARTEGWAAGIYLAGLAWSRGPRDPGRATTVSGRDRYIADYLRSELGLGLDTGDLDFLVATSVLETVTPPVAEALTGTTDALARLERLARENLLVQSIGGDPPTWRYHNLLREYLQAELDRHRGGAARDLHTRAARWYAGQGALGSSTEHALASGDRDLAATFVTRAMLPTFYRGHVDTALRWLDHFTVDELAAHPSLAVLGAWLHLLTGRPEAADVLADIVEGAAVDDPPEDGSASLESSRAMLRAVMGRRGMADALANARLAAEQERPASPWRANALWLLGATQLHAGDPAAAEATFAEAVRAGQRAGATVMVTHAYRASLAIGRGDWTAAAGHLGAGELQFRAGNFGSIAPAVLIHAESARIAAATGDRRRAGEALVQAQLVRPLLSAGLPWFSVHLLIELVRAYLAVDDPTGAELAVREAEAIARVRPDIGVLAVELAALRAGLSRSAGAPGRSSALTAAEQRVLPFLPTYLSFQEIADRLDISRNTVKSHATSIYGKFGSSSRGEAVEKAVELGLLEPYPVLGLARVGRTALQGGTGDGDAARGDVA